MEILICSIDEKQYGLPVGKINSVVAAGEVTKIPNASEIILGIINVHGVITLVLDSRKLMGNFTKELDISDRFILFNLHNKQVALLVDTIESIKSFDQDAFISAENVFPKTPGLEYFIKEDNQLILVYDFEKLIPQELIEN